MSHPALIGVRDSDDLFRHRYLHWADAPYVLVPALIAMWKHVFHRDTGAMTSVLLSHDWSSLRTGLPAIGTGGTLIDAVGAPSPNQAPQPGVGRISRVDPDSYLEWLYLINPETQGIDVFEATEHGGWLLHSRHPFDPDTVLAVSLTNGAGPIAEWVTPQGFTACHPQLADYPLGTVSTALAALAPTGTAVIAAADGNPRTVWLVAGHHALRVTTTSTGQPGLVLLPRPLAGSWAHDQPVRVVSPDLVAEVCDRIQHDYTDLQATARWAVAFATMHEQGRYDASQQAQWWLQDTIGSRTTGDTTTAVRRLAAGIDDGDPAVLDTLPTCPITSSGDPAMAAIYQHLPHLTGPWTGLSPIRREALYAAYEEGFTDGAESAIRRACADLIGHGS